MTIKEREALSGVQRATIRYYEQQGLLSPARLSNGYREYGENELTALLRIRLLRSVDVSIEELRALQRGERELSETLRFKMAELERGSRDAADARELCRRIFEDNAEYSTLDAKGYLEAARPAPASDISAEAEPHPWLRLFARSFDEGLYYLIWLLLLWLTSDGSAFYMLRTGGLVTALITLVFTLLFEPLMLTAFGTTLGKAIFGIRVESASGGRLSYAEAARRTWGVLLRGLGLGLPVYTLIRQYRSYRACVDREPLPWDDGVNYTFKDVRAWRVLAYIAATVAVGLAGFGIMTLDMLPPNRGPLTVAEFAQNYNSLAELYDMDSAGRLTTEGAFAEFGEGAYYERYDVFNQPTGSDFTYSFKDGSVRTVSLTYESRDGGWIMGVSDRLLLAALALTDTDGARLANDDRDAMIDAINTHRLESFSYEDERISIVCSVEYSGYIPFPEADTLMPNEEGEPCSYNISFVLTALR